MVHNYGQLYLVVIRDWGRQVLVEAEHMSLPALDMCSGPDLVRRAAEAFAHRYGLDICVLFTFDAPYIVLPGDPTELTFLSDRETPAKVAVAQPWVDTLPCGSPLMWVPVSFFDNDAYMSQVLLRSLQLLWDRAIGRLREPFRHADWFRSFVDLRIPGCEAADRPLLRHWSGDERRAVIRMTSSRRCVWLKASASNKPQTSMRFVHSLDCIPIPYVPATLGYMRSDRGDWDGVAQEHVEGTPLRESDRSQDWYGTARRIAEIQIAAAEKTHLLHAVGCERWTWKDIEQHSERLLRWINSPVFTGNNLIGIAEYKHVLPSLNDRMRAIMDGFDDLPSTLVRLHFSSSDVVTHPSRGPCFVTWTESAISVPTVWWHSFAQAAHHRIADGSVSLSTLREAYAEPLRDWLGHRQTHTLLHEAEFIANLLKAVRAANIAAAVPVEDEEWMLTEKREWGWILARDPERLSTLRNSLALVLRRLAATQEALC